MTTEEAQRILSNVACHCDGMGVTPGPDGIVIKCPDCDGEWISNERMHEASEIIRGDWSDQL